LSILYRFSALARVEKGPGSWDLVPFELYFEQDGRVVLRAVHDQIGEQESLHFIHDLSQLLSKRGFRHEPLERRTGPGEARADALVFDHLTLTERAIALGPGAEPPAGDQPAG
jgi:hypothetical protein